LTGRSPSRRQAVSLVLMAASGFAGLTYQIVWTQQCALWLGHEATAVLAVVAAFFGGLAAGAFLFGARVAATPRPARWYAGCELTIALWGLGLIAVMPRFGVVVARLMGVQPSPFGQWSLAFVATFVLLLPATAAMGATLPAMERLVSRHHGDDDGGTVGRSIAALYASNTLGAVAGVLAAAFALVPALGLARTAGVCVVLNLACAAAALTLFHRDAVASGHGSPHSSTDGLVRLGPGGRASLLRLALTGFLGIGFEVLVVRVLSQVTEGTVYTFAMLLAVYLLGSATGAAGYRRWRGLRPKSPDAAGATGDRLLAGLAAACLLGTASLWAAPAVKAAVLRAFGTSAAAALAAEAALAVVAFGPAAVVMGALFSHLADRARTAGVSFGVALGANTLGGALAPAAWGVLALPLLGPKAALLLLAGGYLVLTRPRLWLRPLVVAPAVAALALGLFASRLAFVEVPEGGRIVAYREGVAAAVSVVEDAAGVARLRIDDRQQEGSNVTFHFDARQAWVPLLLHPSPRRALFLGLGTGVTAGAAALDPSLQVDAVELLPEVIAVSARFRDELGAGANARLHVHAADARRFVRASEQRYDVIVSDNFHPARSGSGALYTVEHFQAVRQRLAPGGLFCQWLPLHQLDLDSLRSIVRAFLAAYPHGTALLASYSLETPTVGLVGRANDAAFDAPAIQARLGTWPAPERVASLGLSDALAVLGSFVAGPEALRRFGSGVPANSDDRPVVAYRAPWLTYAPDSSPRDRLFALLSELDVTPDQIITTSGPAAFDFSRRLGAYWAARDRFLLSGRDVRPSPRVEEMLAQVRAPLLGVLRLSPDFRPAYDPLLAMAAALATTDAAGARELLGELVRLQPHRPEAAQALASLDPLAPVTAP